MDVQPTDEVVHIRDLFEDLVGRTEPIFVNRPEAEVHPRKAIG